MKNRNIKRIIYHVRYEYLTTNNIILTVALMIAASWAFASVQAVDRNYKLQHEVDSKRRGQQLAELEMQNLTFEQHYFKSREYQELEAKRRIGLALPGEKVLILPPNSARAKAVDNKPSPVSHVAPIKKPPLIQWVDFLFGAKTEKLQK